MDEAGDRYEKRYMEKENKKLRAEHERKERARIIKLVERCYNADPRIRREQEQIEAEKERRKEEKRAMKVAKHREQDDLKR